VRGKDAETRLHHQVINCAHPARPGETQGDLTSGKIDDSGGGLIKSASRDFDELATAEIGQF
jgi:hypothetical protein